METEMLHAIDDTKIKTKRMIGSGRSKSIKSLATELEKKINFKLESIKLGLVQIQDDQTTQKDREVCMDIVLREIKELEPVQSLIEYQWPDLHRFMCDLKEMLDGQ